MSNIKNVEAFGKLKGICTGFGGTYKPGQPNLQVTAMDALLIKARKAIGDEHTAKTDFNNATNVREVKFKDTLRLCSRIINALKSNGAAALTVEDAQAIVRKMYGKKLPAAPAVTTDKVEAAKTRTRTARGLDYGSMVDHFAKLVQTVSVEPSYLPNEPELAVAGLNTTLASLRSLNDAVNVASVKLSNIRNDRSALFYTGKNNLVATAKAAKQYVRAAYGPRSVQTTEVSRIRFTKPQA
jgi:hypothetical protein